MAKFTLEYHGEGRYETFDFSGTREDFINARFGNGGLNPAFATLSEVVDAEEIVAPDATEALPEEPAIKPKKAK